MFNIRAKYFVYLLFILLIFISILYIYLYINQIEKISLNYPSYKTFLLKETKSFNRIIIESGSNSFHGINSEMMEKEFNKLVLNISDNAGVPLKHKLLRIREFSKKGDIVIMPLEYIHYSYEGIAKSYFDDIFSYYNFYFGTLPFVEKIKFIAQTPFDSFIKSFFKNWIKVNNTAYFIENFNDGFRGDNKFTKKRELSTDNCEEYIFKSNIKFNFSINDTFIENAKLIKEIEKEKDIKFILTYPTVVGNNCYEGKYFENFKKLDNEINQYLKENNIIFIGSPNDSYFPEEFINDTNYHVLPEARDLRTNKLIKNIKESQIYSLFIDNNTKYEYKLKLNDFVDTDLLMPINIGETIKINSNKIILTEGWYNIEEWGVWSKGEKSNIIFKIDKTKMNNNLNLIIESKIAGSQTTTQIFLNGKFSGEYLLNGLNKINLTKDLTNGKSIEIEFRNIDVKSPYELGTADDKRKIKLGLEYLKIEEN